MKKPKKPASPHLDSTRTGRLREPVRERKINIGDTIRWKAAEGTVVEIFNHTVAGSFYGEIHLLEKNTLIFSRNEFWQA